MVTEKLRLYTGNNEKKTIFLVQGEAQSRELKVSVFDGNNDPVSMENAVAVLYVKKPDGNMLMLPGAVEFLETGDEATFVLTLQVCAEAGECRSWVQLVYPDGRDLRVQGPEFFVTPCVTDDAVESREEFTALEEALAQTAQYRSHVEDQENPHHTTAQQVGARPETWMPTAQEVGARPADWLPNAEETGAVPLSRTVNGKPLSSDIVLTWGDVGARPDDWLPTLSQLGLTVSQGEWTPSLFAYAGTTNPTVSYNSQKGYYYRIGNLVHIIFSITGNITKLGNGNAGIKGLPSELLPQMASPVTLGRCFFLVGTDPTVSFTANIDGSTGEIQIRNAGGRTRQNFVLSSTDSFEVLGSATYIAGA